MTTVCVVRKGDTLRSRPTALVTFGDTRLAAWLRNEPEAVQGRRVLSSMVGHDRRTSLCCARRSSTARRRAQAALARRGLRYLPQAAPEVERAVFLNQGRRRRPVREPPVHGVDRQPCGPVRRLLVPRRFEFERFWAIGSGARLRWARCTPATTGENGPRGGRVGVAPAANSTRTQRAVRRAHHQTQGEGAWPRSKSRFPTSAISRTSRSSSCWSSPATRSRPNRS